MLRSLGVLVPHEFGLDIAGVPIGISGIVTLLFNGLTSWIVSGATALLSALGHVITDTSEPTLNSGFSVELGVLVRIGAALTAPFLVLATMSAIAHQDIGVLLRAVFIRLPLSLLLGGVAIELVSLALVATNGLSNAVLDTAGPSINSILDELSTSVAALSLTNAQFGAFACAFLAGCAAVVAFMLWLELVLRSAAISVAVLFLPIALAGIVWPATAHWAKRLGEIIAALVLSKLVIAGVLALAATSIDQGSGPSAVVEGIAILLLAVLAPFSLLRLVPAIESGALSHFEGLSHRALRQGQNASGFAASLVNSTTSEDVPSSPTVSAIPILAGSDMHTPVIDEIANGVRQNIEARGAALNDGGVRFTGSTTDSDGTTILPGFDDLERGDDDE